MTKDEKEDKLKELDENVLNLLIKNTGENGDSSLLTELSVPVNYLKSNSVIAEKAKSNVEDETKERLRKAKERRDNKETPQ